MSGPGQRPYLTTNDSLLGFGRTVGSLEACADYRRGYLTGMVRGDANLKTYRYERPGRQHGDVHRFRLALVDDDGLDRAQDFLQQEGIPTARFMFTAATPQRRAVSAIRNSSRSAVEAITALIDWPVDPSTAWRRGFLAGIFDAEGSRSHGVLRISNSDEVILRQTQAALAGFGFDAVLEDPGLANEVKTVRVRGGLREHLRFTHLVDPAIRRKCSVDGIAVKSDADLRVLAIEPLGLDMPMFDITTGTGDFIANGVISHNCFARRTHEWLEFDSGRDFDTQVVVKTNLVEVLERELARPSWQREHVALGTNTDPYQRAEGRYRLMPGVIRALARSGHAVLDPDERHAAAPGHPAAGRGCAGRADRPRRLDGHLGRRPAPRPGAGRPDTPGPPRPRPRADRRRPAVRCLPRPGPARAHRHTRSTSTPPSARSPRRAPAGSPSSRCTCARARASGSWRGSAAPTPSSSRGTSSCTPGGPTSRPSTAPGWPSGWRRSWPGTGWTGSPAAPPARPTPDRDRRAR